ncbi:hypothetical protein D9M68_740310 [compost metagenome]
MAVARLSRRPLVMMVPLALLKLARAWVAVPEQFFSSMVKSVSPVVSPALARFSARASLRTTVAGLGVTMPLTEMSQVLPSTEPLKWMMLVAGEARAAWLAPAISTARESFLIMLDVLLVRGALLGLHREAWPPVSGVDGPKGPAVRGDARHFGLPGRATGMAQTRDSGR